MSAGDSPGAGDPREHRDDLSEVEERLRASRADASEIELDRIKREAMARASRSSRRVGTAPRRVMSVLAAGALVIGGGGAVLAASSGSGGGGNAAAKQYCPPAQSKKCPHHHH